MLAFGHKRSYTHRENDCIQNNFGEELVRIIVIKSYVISKWTYGERMLRGNWSTYSKDDQRDELFELIDKRLKKKSWNEKSFEEEAYKLKEFKSEKVSWNEREKQKRCYCWDHG